VVALMADASASPVTTCSIGYDVADLDEAGYASDVAGRFRTDHRSCTVSLDDFAAMDSLVAMFDEPFADASALLAARICQFARESVTVALSGDGADEVLAGYRRHLFQRGEDRLRSLIPLSVRQPVFGTLGAIWPSADWVPRPLRAKSTLLSFAASSEEGYARSLSVTPPEQRDMLYSSDFLGLRGDYRGEQSLEALMRSAPARSGLDRAQYADLKFWLPGGILTMLDRASMAVSLEVREPFLDHRLVEFAASLPEAMRIRRGQGKWLMKRTMRRYLPDTILYRPRQGFVTPVAQWFRGPLAEAARGIGEGGGLARTGWFHSPRISALASAHIAGRADYARLLWQLLMLDKSLERLGLAG
jgi:asparagine synthase (glutamine-hydrolysing)